MEERMSLLQLHRFSWFSIALEHQPPPIGKLPAASDAVCASTIELTANPEKSRQEKRKEARLAKNARKNESWLQRQKVQKLESSKLQRNHKVLVFRMRKANPQFPSWMAEEDWSWKGNLQRKLKVKGGKLKGEDLGLNMLFEGFQSFADSLGNKEGSNSAALPSKQSEKSSPTKKRKKEKLLEGGLPVDSKVEVPKVVVTDGAEVQSEDFPSKTPLRKNARRETPWRKKRGQQGR
ncbi:hypothetical protein M0R45_008668 [Rubus argutus]|uniref:Uncharacterized protein n=1 Tax=Rubus argutus TaxID=59490 RepID=A0AAW1Y2B8_RUBAR